MRKINKNNLYYAIISFFISSAMIWFMPLGSFEQDGSTALAIILAAVIEPFYPHVPRMAHTDGDFYDGICS